MSKAEQHVLSHAAQSLLDKLREIANRGPIPAASSGSPAVGMTLLQALGVPYTSRSKPNFQGVAIGARRGLGEERANRVNLFARVPDWKSSPFRSSEEIATAFGYPSPGVARKLYCTVRVGRPNAQGLYLVVDEARGVLEEHANREGRTQLVVVWPLGGLGDRLIRSHPESMWVRAISTYRDGVEHFHYRKAVYTGTPYVERLAELLAEGTITLDHLIQTGPTGTIEKGPLFKISPQNIPLLFPTSLVFDLLSP